MTHTHGVLVCSRPASTAPQSTAPLYPGAVEQPDIQRAEPAFPRGPDHVRCLVVAVIDEEHGGIRLNRGREPSQQRLHVLGFIPRWHQDRKLPHGASRRHRIASSCCRAADLPCAPFPATDAPSSLSAGTPDWPFIPDLPFIPPVRAGEPAAAAPASTDALRADRWRTSCGITSAQPKFGETSRLAEMLRRKSSRMPRSRERSSEMSCFLPLRRFRERRVIARSMIENGGKPYASSVLASSEVRVSSCDSGSSASGPRPMMKIRRTVPVSR